MYQINNSIAKQGFDKLQIQKLIKNDNLEVLNISLEKGQIFPEHTSPKEATLVVLEGDIVFHINGEDYPIAKFEHVTFPKETKHWVEAFENAKFLIVR